MAREVHRREDLLRDARALVPRVQLRTVLFGEPVIVFAGFRGEALSLYFDEDPVLHFNAQGQLRRAHFDERLIKAERGRLVALERTRTAEEVALARHEFDAERQELFLQDVAARLGELRSALADAGRWELLGQFPEEGAPVERLQSWLAAHPAPAAADSARVGR